MTNETQLDETSGYLEARAVTPGETFDAHKKALFLEMFVKSPNISAISKELGFTPQTIYNHLQIDARFKEDLDRARAEITDRLEARVAEYAERPTHFMDRIAWLRAHRPERWAPDMKLNVQVDHRTVEPLFDRAKAIDATSSPAIAPQENASPSQEQVPARDMRPPNRDDKS